MLASSLAHALRWPSRALHQSFSYHQLVYLHQVPQLKLNQPKVPSHQIQVALVLSFPVAPGILRIMMFKADCLKYRKTHALRDNLSNNNETGWIHV